MQSLPALWASSQHHEWHLQDLFQRAGTSFCHTFGTCVPWQGPGGEWAQNDREELGRAGLMKGKIILNLKKKKIHQQLHQLILLLPSPSLDQHCCFLWPVGSTHPLSSPERAFQGREGRPKSSHITKTLCCQGNSSPGNGSLILGLFSAPLWLCVPTASGN